MDFSNVQWLDMANRSLAMVSSAMLSRMDEGSSESNYVSILLPQAVEEVYASLPLDDISLYAMLPKTTNKAQAGSGYEYAYKLPASCASIREVNADGESWQRIKGAILTSNPTVSIRYVPLPTGPDDIPYYARNLICVLLASRLAGPIAHNETLANLLRNQYDVLLSRAFTLSGQASNQEDYASSTPWAEDRE